MNDKPIAIFLWCGVITILVLMLFGCSSKKVVYQRKPDPNIFIKNDSVYVETGKHFVVFPYSTFSVKRKQGAIMPIETLTEREYDKLVNTYVATKNPEILKRLSNCKIITTPRRKKK